MHKVYFFLVCVTGTHSSNQSYSNTQNYLQIKIQLAIKIRQNQHNRHSHDSPYPRKKKIWDAIISKTSHTMGPGSIIHFWEGPLTYKKVTISRRGEPLENRDAALRATQNYSTVGRTVNLIKLRARGEENHMKSGNRTMGQAISFKNRMGQKHTQISKRRMR